MLGKGLAGGLRGEYAQSQIENALSDAPHLGAVGVDDHALGDGSVAEVGKPRRPSTCARQVRHAPIAGMAGSLHRWGM